MDKRYQVFVSSTFIDLKDERASVLQTLMEMDCIPSGMELFPAMDEDQFKFIQKIIDDCDYYLLILGGRYGTLSNDGISYTEKEYDYAKEIGLKIIAMIHEAPEDIPWGKSEQDSVSREKLRRFKEKVTGGKMVKFWKTSAELSGHVSISLTKTIRYFPAVGWVRGNQVASAELLTEINDLRKQNDQLATRLALAEDSLAPVIENIAKLDSPVTIHGTYRTTQSGDNARNISFEINITWLEIFSLISPYLITHPVETAVKLRLAKDLKKQATEKDSGYSINIDDQEFKTIALQLEAHGLVKVKFLPTTKGDRALFWLLTKKGEKFMIEQRVIRDDS